MDFQKLRIKYIILLFIYFMRYHVFVTYNMTHGTLKKDFIKKCIQLSLVQIVQSQVNEIYHKKTFKLKKAK